MNEIKPYIYVRSKVNGFDYYHYLHIRGGAGINPLRGKKQRYGGEYTFILFYASPEEMEGLDKCERIWCEEKGIVYGEGLTIEAAHADYLKKISQNHGKQYKALY